ncbi:hypothetical protein HYN59_13860 [Flavobacterium album]|uniref:PsbP C-terminal domain-containing protein n=1 Tax=Flavobacterium album TaxID=2175091 RepID=A0A2S1R0D9_9FLAO|nr:PsbP-related protein [Flavobacterium album]AWH86128.1 hypothetical protein HYN59_13860 [Flavobacterium album]
MNTKYLILFFLITVKGFSQTLDKNIIKSDYSINYSSNWKLDETGRNGSDFILISSTFTGKFRNNINLLIQNLKGTNLNLDTFTELSKNQINSKGKLITSRKKSANGKEFQELTFEVSIPDYNVKFLQYYFLKNEKAYILTFTALNSEFDNLLPEVIQIMDSFQI